MDHPARTWIAVTVACTAMAGVACSGTDVVTESEGDPGTADGVRPTDDPTRDGGLRDDADAGPIDPHEPEEPFPVEDGWTKLAPSKDSRVVHVSSSKGLDTNDGLSPARPVKTIAKARTLLRNGYPDWMVLERGEVWNEPLASASQSWTLSGRSKSEPMVVGAYGTGARPRLDTGAQAGFAVVRLGASPPPLHDLAIVGIHFRAHTRIFGTPAYVGPAGGDGGIQWVRAGANLLVEDCMVEAYPNGITIQGDLKTDGTPIPVANVAIRRSVVVDAYKVTGTKPLPNSSGIYVARAKDLVLDGNVLDHNGWNETVPDAPATEFNHDVYVQVDVEGLVAKNNFFLRASSYGIEAKAYGRNDVVDNVFVGDATATEWGMSRGNNAASSNGSTGRISGNAVLDARDQTATTRRGGGIEIGNVAAGGVVVEGNILAHSQSVGSYSAALFVDTDFPGSIGVKKAKIANNTVVDWATALRVNDLGGKIASLTIDDNTFVDMRARTSLGARVDVPRNTIASGVVFTKNVYVSAAPVEQWFALGTTRMSFANWLTRSKETGAATAPPTFVDDTRDVASYMGTLGKTPTKDTFFAAVRTQSRATWSADLTTAAVLKYLRAGYAH